MAEMQLYEETRADLIQVDSTKIWTNEGDTFVLLEHCEQVVFIL